MDPSKVDPKDCFDIMLTDIQLHAQKVRNPNALGRQVAKVVHAGKKIGRAYSNDLKLTAEGGTLSIDIGMREYLHELARQKGKKYVRIFKSKSGLPVYFGKDTVERLESLRKKHLQRLSKRVYNKKS